MSWIYPTLLILLEIAAICSAIHSLFNGRTTQGTVAWVIGLITFPWLAVPLYWAFGARRFEAYSKVMKQALVRHREAIHGVLREIDKFRVPRSEIEPRGVGDLASVGGEHFVHGNRLDLLIDGEATFDAILKEIGQAKHYIFIQFYIVREDGLGLRVLEALAKKADEGVKVCFLFDAWGSPDMKPHLVEKWCRRGVKMAAFRPHQNWRERFQLNFRNHRKNVVVDGLVGFVGGHNIGDEYLGKYPKFGRWRDTHVRVEGPSAMQLQLFFAADWFFATGEVLDQNWTPEPAENQSDLRSLVLASGPSDAYERCALFFLNVISMAQHRLWIASPYFVPDTGILQALRLAALRGVEVRLLLPLKPDHLLVWLASFAMLEELEHPNIKVYRFTEGFLHQKVVLVDDSFASVGTANFDNRSFRLNFELTLAVSGKPFASEVEAMLLRDFEESIQVDRHDYEKRPLHFKVGAHIARLLAPIL